MSPSLISLLDDAERKFPDRTFVRQGADRRTYAQVAQASRRLASALRALEGVTPGACVAVFMENRIEFIDLIFGVARAGLVLVPVNRHLTAPHVEAILDDCDAKVLVTDDPTLHAVAQSRTVIRIDAGAPAEALRYEAFSAAPATSEGDDLPAGAIYYTTGTTGLAKGVVRTDESHVWMAFGASAVLSTTRDDVWLFSMPFSSVAVYGLGLQVVLNGGQLVLPLSHSADDVLDALVGGGVTHAFMSPTLWGRVHASGIRRQERPLDLKWAIWGGMPITRALLTDLERWLPVPCTGVYGLTEAGCAGYADKWSYRAGNCNAAGYAVPGTRFRVVDEAGNEQGPGAVGEVQISGPVVMTGYLGMSEATRDVLRDGWIATGDLGSLDPAGLLHIHDRRKELIISGGENVAPALVESVIADMTTVLDVAVVGMPDSDWGEAVCAAVVRSDPSLTVGDVRQHASEHLPSFMKPKRVYWVDSIPRNAYGKADKVALRVLLETSEAAQ